jgi:hypothetical protein
MDQLFENWRKFINEENAKSSGVLSNVFKLCPAGTKCKPESKKTKWWKGR